MLTLCQPKETTFLSFSGLGRCLAGRGIKVVFGGSAFGLLGTLADAVLEGGGQLTGIIPEFFTRELGVWLIATSALATETVLLFVIQSHPHHKMC